MLSQPPQHLTHPFLDVCHPIHEILGDDCSFGIYDYYGNPIWVSDQALLNEIVKQDYTFIPASSADSVYNFGLIDLQDNQKIVYFSIEKINNTPGGWFLALIPSNSTYCNPEKIVGLIQEIQPTVIKIAKEVDLHLNKPDVSAF